jgi:hypothetical protein
MRSGIITVSQLRGQSSNRHTFQGSTVRIPVWVSHGKDDGNHASCTKANNGGKDSEGEKGDNLALPTDCGNASGAVTGSKLDGRESYTMATEANFPGFKRQGDQTWNLHWAGVVMKDGADNITLENFAVTEETATEAGVPQGKYIDRDWNFDMYGTVDAKGEVNEDQTFHKEHLDTGTHGTHATSMVVRTDK